MPEEKHYQIFFTVPVLLPSNKNWKVIFLKNFLSIKEIGKHQLDAEG